MLGIPTPTLWLLLAWFVVQETTRQIAIRTIGSRSVNGTPRWRCVVNFPTGGGFLPAIYVAARARHSSFAAWQAASAVSYDELEWAFVLIFAAYFAVDWATHRVPKLMTLHHVACLVGHVGVCGFLRLGFATYFTGCVALEAGSVCCNIWCLRTRNRVHIATYSLGMTASNLLASVYVVGWVLLPFERLPARLFGALPGVIIAIRQKEQVASVGWGLGENRKPTPWETRDD